MKSALCFLLAFAAASAQQSPLLQWMDAKAQQQLSARESRIAAIQDVGAAKKRQAEVRQIVLKNIGGVPNYTGPLLPRVTGRINAEGYVIEKLYFQSLPNYFVTANVYRPVQPGRYPAILFQSGHTQEGKTEPQHSAANLARKGFVVLTFDPLGQGEREQTYLPQLGRSLSGGGGNEHLTAGSQSLLIGQSVARYFIWDAMRAVDYLASRPDVDANRIGAAGCSGAGALTAYVGALDPRIKAVATACYVSSYRLVFPGPTPDSEMSLPSFLASGLDIADFSEMAAPKPWLLLATEEDYFTPAGAKMVYDEAARWFGLFNASDRLQFQVHPGPHGTPRESREAIYTWMTRWLKEGKGNTTDDPVHLYTNFELRVTPTGNVDSLPGSRKIFEVIREEYRRLRSPKSVQALQEELKRRGVPTDRSTPRIKVLDEATRAGIRVQNIELESDPGILLTGRLYIPRETAHRSAVIIPEDKALRVPLFVQPSRTTGALAESLARAGQIVLELSPRDDPSTNEGRPFLGNWTANLRAELIGLNLPALRAHDLLRGVDYLASRPDVDASKIRGAGRGVKGIWLMYAAAVDDRLAGLWLDKTPHNFSGALDRTFANHLFDVLITGFALHWEIADLQKAIAPRPILWTDPVDWMNIVQPLGPKYEYRYVGEPDDRFIAAFIR